jgi:hypothetical protein
MSILVKVLKLKSLKISSFTIYNSVMKFIYILFFISLNIYAADEIGKIEFLKGEGVINSVKAASLDMPVFEKDIVQTKEKSVIKIKLNDNTIINLGPESHMVLEKFSTGPRHSLINFMRGQIRIKYNEKAKSAAEHLEIKVPNASLGVRGTDILSTTQLVKESMESVNVLIEGHVEVAANGLTNSLQMIPGDAFSSATKIITKINPADLLELTKNADQLFDHSFLNKLDTVTKEVVKESATTAAQTTATATGTGVSTSIAAAGMAAVGGIASAGNAVMSVGEVSTGSLNGVATMSHSAIPTPNLIGSAKVLNDTAASTTSEKSKLIIPVGTSDDIKEVIENREEMRKKNKCYYWVYYKKEVSGLYYHSRKTRACNEYDVD